MAEIRCTPIHCCATKCGENDGLNAPCCMIGLCENQSKTRMFRPWPPIARFSRSFSSWCQDMSSSPSRKRHHKGRRLRSMTRWNLVRGDGRGASGGALRVSATSCRFRFRALFSLDATTIE